MPQNYMVICHQLIEQNKCINNCICKIFGDIYFFKLYKLIYKTARKNQLTRHICRGDNMILSAILWW